MNILSKVTLKNLKKNKVRTTVTIIGIILSVSMFTAVTTIISSLQNYMLKTVENSIGSYHCIAPNISEQKLKDIENNPDFNGIATMQNLGYAKVNSINESKPYLFVGSMSENFTDYVSIKLINGRMPKNTNEIILPDHLKKNGGISDYDCGDLLNITLGDRILNNKSLTQNDPFDETEKLNEQQKKTYTVVGFYERHDFEPFLAPGYTALTTGEKNSNKDYNVFYCASKVNDIYDISKKYFKNNFDNDSLDYNTDLLMYYGTSQNSEFKTVLYGFAGVLIIIIMLGSISLIYNAFSISVSERTKQFGLLKSIGATKRQILHSVLFEALFLGIIGIPLGALAGIGGIGVVLFFMKDMFASFVSNDSYSLTLSISWEAVIIACIIGLITILISAYIPAKRASKQQAIESIRQSGDIKIKANKIKTSKLTYKLFGFSGMFAKKNFKRSRKKYRSTVISLFISIILFITATTFTDYLTTSLNNINETSRADIVASFNENLSKEQRERAEKTLKQIKGIDEYSRLTTMYADEMTVNSDILTEEFTKSDYCTSIEGNKSQKDISGLGEIQFIPNDNFIKYLKKHNLSEENFLNQKTPIALFQNQYTYFNVDKQKFEQVKVFKNSDNVITHTTFLKAVDGYYCFEIKQDKNGNKIYIYANDEDDSKKTKTFSDDEIAFNCDIKIAGFFEASDAPFGCWPNLKQPCMIIPEMYKDYFISNSKNININRNEELLFNAKNHKEVFSKMEDAIAEYNISGTEVNDNAAIYEISNNLNTIIKIFTYGFIILISLISIANVFNTISTNISLRRREFATLKSVGMQNSSFNRMMNYECILYGCKSLIYGLPVGILISYLLGRILQEGYQTNFIFPYKAIIIVTVTVFLVVFITMLYSMRKIKKDSPIEALKNENI